MKERITPEQRKQIRKLLSEGHDRATVAAFVGVSPAQVAAVRAHVSMGTYERSAANSAAVPTTYPISKADNMLRVTGEEKQRDDSPIYLGTDLETGSSVFWNPLPTGSANPHVLILGESGFGKTYTAICLTAELAKRRIASVILDYGQGFSPSAIPDAAWANTAPESLDLATMGISLNPLTIAPSDVRGPTSVAQRVADSFSRVYSRIGVQQHAVLRDAILDVFYDVGIKADNPNSWEKRAPAFHQISAKLQSYAADSTNPNRRYASSAASHVSTLFIFNIFRSTGQRLAWDDLLSDKITVLGFRGLEPSVQRLVTEFVLWNLIGHLESVGPQPLRAFVVLDEAHRMSFADNSPVEKLLREARKLGVGLMLASQQPEDFSAVAFANTATKIVFQITDDRSVVSRNIHRKISNHSFPEVFETITRLPRGCAYVVTGNVGYRVKIASLEERSAAV
jgi:DNA phosphorothioation-dependent restriction protein DptH